MIRSIINTNSNKHPINTIFQNSTSQILLPMPQQLDSLQLVNLLQSRHCLNFASLSILFLSLLTLINSASYAPTWLTSNYIRSANQDLFNTLTGSGVVNTYSFTFSSPFSGIPHLGYGIKSYQGNDYFGQERFQISTVNLTNDAFTVAVELIGATNLYILNVPYIAIDPLFPHHLNSFDNVPVNYSAGPLVNVSARNSVPTYYSNVINYTDQAMSSSHNRFSQPLSSNKILLFLTCMYIAGNNEPFSAPSSDYNPLDLRVYTQILSNQTYLINVTLRINIGLDRLQYSMIIFNQDDVQASLQYFLEYQRVDFYTSVGGFLPVPPQFIDNFIMGFTEFSSYRTLAAIHFQWSFTIQNGVHGVYMPPSIGRSPYQTVITRVQFTVFYMKTWVCPNNTFMDIPTNLCKDCPFQGCLQCLSYKQCSVCDTRNQYKLLGSGCIRCDVDNNFYLNPDTLQCQQCPQHECPKSRIQKGQCNTLIITISQSSKLPIVYNQSLVAIENSGIHVSHSSYTQQTKQLKIYAEYDRDVPSHQNIVVYVGKNNRRVIQVDSSVALMVYTPLQCKYEDGFVKLIQAIRITSFVVLFLSLFTAKIVGLQLFGVLQLAYFALGSYSYLNIYNAPFQMLKSTNGYNLYYLLPTTPPTKILHYLSISNTFLNNINIMLLIPVLLMILSFVIYVLSKLALNKIMEQKITNFFKQGFITLIMFNAFNFCYSAGLHSRYGYLSITVEWAIGSWVAIGLGVLIFGVFVGIMEIGNSEHFGEFKNKFKQTWVCLFYIPLSVIYRAVIAFYLSSNIDYQDSTLLVLAASISFLLYFIVNLPFINYYQNYRAGICHLTQLITLFAANYYRSMKSNTPIGIKSRLYAFTILLIVMICICVFISIVVLAVEIVEWVRNICKKRARRVHDQSRRQTEASMVQIQASVNNYSQKF